MIKKSAFLIVMLALSSAATGDAARFRAAAAAEKNGLSLGPLTIRKGDRNPKKSSSNNRSKKDVASSSSNSDELAGGQASIAAMIFNLVNNVAGEQHVLSYHVCRCRGVDSHMRTPVD